MNWLTVGRIDGEDIVPLAFGMVANVLAAKFFGLERRRWLGRFCLARISFSD